MAAASAIRLGVKEDMDDPKICVALGNWYRELHAKGREYIVKDHNAMYSETDCLTRESMEYVMHRTHTEQLSMETKYGRC